VHSFDLILTLTGGLAAALVFGYLTKRARLSPIVGYLLAGVAVDRTRRASLPIPFSPNSRRRSASSC
jgi:predicted Kef-type K+ transport protein